MEVAAICDVDRTHADFAAGIAAARTGKKPLVFYDFRQLLERTESTPSSSPRPITGTPSSPSRPCEAGKDVYCEKPLTLFIEEGRRVVDAARQYGTVFQVGSQQRSDWRFRHAVDLVRSNRIGRLNRITTHLGNPGTTQGAFVHPGEWEPVETPPPELDWNMWLGPAPYKDYSPTAATSSSAITWTTPAAASPTGARTTTTSRSGRSAWTNSGPVEIEGKGVFNKPGPYDYANFLEVHYHYANGVEVVCENEGGNGVRFQGTDGWILRHALSLEASKPEILADADRRNRHARIRREEPRRGNSRAPTNTITTGSIASTAAPCAADAESGIAPPPSATSGISPCALGRPLRVGSGKRRIRRRSGGQYSEGQAVPCALVAVEDNHEPRRHAMDSSSWPTPIRPSRSTPTNRSRKKCCGPPRPVRSRRCSARNSSPRPSRAKAVPAGRLVSQ